MKYPIHRLEIFPLEGAPRGPVSLSRRTTQSRPEHEHDHDHYHEENHPHPDNPEKRQEHLALFELVKHENVSHRAIQNGLWSDTTTWMDIDNDQIPELIGEFRRRFLRTFDVDLRREKAIGQ